MTFNDDTLVIDNTGSAVPLVVTINDGVCAVSALATNGKPIAALKIIDKNTGKEVPVNIFTCTEAVICNAGIPMQVHLQNLYNHAEDANAHLTAGEKAELETKRGAQEKADAAKRDAINEASLMVESAQTAARDYAIKEAANARSSAYRYSEQMVGAHASNISNPHGVTAAQVGAFPAIKDETSGCYYYLVNGKKEWINPPMKVDVEYRTIERRMEKPVYTMLINIGPLIPELSIQLPQEVGVNADIFRMEASCCGYPLPTKSGTSVFVNSNDCIECVINGDNDLYAETVYVQLWYTKN